MRDVPEERPRLDDLYAIVKEINIDGTDVACFEDD